MFSIIGILVVLGSVIGGFLMEKGKLPVLIQPAEFLTIAGAAIGTVLAANPTHVLKGVAAGVLGVIKGQMFLKDVIPNHSRCFSMSSVKLAKKA